MSPDERQRERRLPRSHGGARTGPVDPHSLDILEYAKVKAMLAGYAACSLGRAAIKTLEPMTTPELLRPPVAETTELRELLKRRGRLPVAGMTDVRPAVAGTEGGESVIEPPTFRDIASTLRAAREFKLLFAEEAGASPHLGQLAERLDDFAPLCEEIDAIIANDGSVHDHASPQLAQLRRQLEATGTRLRDKAYTLARSPTLRPFLQADTVGVRRDHYVLAVRAECKHRLDGIIYDRSQTGATVYVEPRELVILANQLDDLRFEERREISRLLRELTFAVRDRREPILRTLDTLAHVDLTYAKARFSIDYDMSPPEVNDVGHLDVHRARHPILVRVLERSEDAPADQKVVPIDYRLGEDFDLLVVTGPNTGGKTVSLKTIGLLSLMAQSGMHVPADPGAQFPVYEDVLADIGDEQSIEQSLSTFSSHMTNIVRILGNAHRRTLVLLDELGAGTDPADGAALGTAILDHLGSRCVKTVVTTHIGELKAYAYRHDRALNAACEFDEQSLRPTYRLLLGQPGSSNAVAIAERLGLPRSISERAKGIVRRRRGRDSDIIADLQKTRRAIEEDREHAHSLRQEAEELRNALEAKVRAAERQAAAARREAEGEIDEEAKRLRHHVAEGLRHIRNAPAPFADRARALEESLEHELERTPLAAKRLEFARSLKRDDIVHVIPFGEKCRVRSINKTRKRLAVVLGHSIVEVSFDDVTWVEPSP